MTAVPLVLGLLWGGGAVCVTRGLRPRPKPLAVALDQIETPGGARRFGEGILVTIAAWSAPREHWAADLSVTGIDERKLAVDRLLLAVALLSIGLATGTALAVVGFAVSGVVIAAVATALGLVGFAVPGARIRAEARRRRREFVDAFSAFLDLVTIVVAGGGGVETALDQASKAGSHWAFGELNTALDSARLGGQTPWQALDTLGTRIGVGAVRETAAALALAGERGAHLRDALSARAGALRSRRLADIEADAQAATERMSVPVVLMLFGFVAFVMYPALHFVLEGL